MKALGVTIGLLAFAGVVLGAQWVHGQTSGDTRASGGTVGQGDPGGYVRQLRVLGGRPEIGARVTEAENDGVRVEDVQSDSPAAKAGLRKDDVIVSFDGERVRSTRQLTRLIQETAPGKAVGITIVRGGQRQDLRITPADETFSRRFGDFDWESLRNRLPFDLGFQGSMMQWLPEMTGRRLGVTVEEMRPQLAQYFGAREGVLVTSVTDDSPAKRAGLRAGDVITSLNGEAIRSRGDLLRAVRDANGRDVAITIVRDRKETSVSIQLPTLSPR